MSDVKFKIMHPLSAYLLYLLISSYTVHLLLPIAIFVAWDLLAYVNLKLSLSILPLYYSTATVATYFLACVVISAPYEGAWNKMNMKHYAKYVPGDFYNHFVYLIKQKRARFYKFMMLYGLLLGYLLYRILSGVYGGAEMTVGVDDLKYIDILSFLPVSNQWLPFSLISFGLLSLAILISWLITVGSPLRFILELFQYYIWKEPEGIEH